MMARPPRVVAELGRPETPDEAADRKAASSATYRSSKTVRNLVAAMLVTLAAVAVVYFAVPRGEIARPKSIDVAAVAAQISRADDRAVLVPTVPDTWLVNRAQLDSSDGRAWSIGYVPGENEGFVNVAQGFDQDAGWIERRLDGIASDAVVDIGGVSWQSYTPTDPRDSGNISSALSTTAGSDAIVIYGSTGAENAVRVVAESLAEQIRALEEGAG